MRVGSTAGDMASEEEPSHLCERTSPCLSPEDGAVHAAGGIRRHARANRPARPRVDDAAQDLQQDAHVREEMEARALAVLLAGLSDPDSRPELAASARSARRRRRKARSEGSSRAGSCAGAFSWSQSSLQSLVNRYEASPYSPGSSDDQSRRRERRDSISQGSSFSSAHSAGSTGSSRVNDCYDDGDRSNLSMQSCLVQRLNQVLTERDVGGNSESQLGGESLGIQRTEIMVLAAMVLFPPVALLAALAAVLYLL